MSSGSWREVPSIYSPKFTKLFAHFNNPDLLAKERNLENLRTLRNETDPAIRAVTDLIDRHHAALYTKT